MTENNKQLINVSDCKSHAEAVIKIQKIYERGKTTHGLTYCRREMKGKGPLGKTSNKWCACGHKRHGANHDLGSHHKSGMRKK